MGPAASLRIEDFAGFRLARSEEGKKWAGGAESWSVFVRTMP